MKHFLLILWGALLGLLMTYPKTPVQTIKVRDYQLYLTEDSVHMYDGERLVGTAPLFDGKIGQLIYTDNL